MHFYSINTDLSAFRRQNVLKAGTSFLKYRLLLFPAYKKHGGFSLLLQPLFSFVNTICIRFGSSSQLLFLSYIADLHNRIRKNLRTCQKALDHHKLVVSMHMVIHIFCHAAKRHTSFQMMYVGTTAS